MNEVKRYGAVVAASQETKWLEMMFTMLDGAQFCGVTDS